MAPSTNTQVNAAEYPSECRQEEEEQEEQERIYSYSTIQ